MAGQFFEGKIPLFFLLIIISSSNKSETNGVIVKLFEWRWEDIAQECEDFLAPNGFSAVEVSPPSEHRVIKTSFHHAEITRPWIERYQIVSYKLVSRSGNETQFENMVQRCNQVGVRVFVEAVINHMTSPDGHGLGIGNNTYSGTSKVYDGVPYYYESFHSEKDCPTKYQVILNFSDPIQVRNCRLMGFLDLDHSKEPVQKSVVGYLNHLIHLGVSGFRIHAANHIWPQDLQSILKKIIFLSIKYFPPNSKSFIYQEITSFPFSVNEFLELGKITEFYYAMFVSKILRKDQEFKLANFRELLSDDLHTTSSSQAMVFIDHQDLQRMASEDTLTFRDGKLFHLANIILLTFPYGQPIIMSSYFWTRLIEFNQDQNHWIGPPSNDDYETLPVIRFLNNTCGNGWVCEHRNSIIKKLVTFYNIVGNDSLSNWWDNSENQIAFSRGNKGFAVINNDIEDMRDLLLQTGLFPGQYCDIISGQLINNACTGKVIEVNQIGKALITLLSNEYIPAVVIHSLSIIKPRPPDTTGFLPRTRDNSINIVTRSTTASFLEFNNDVHRGIKPEHGERDLNLTRQETVKSSCSIQNTFNHNFMYLFIVLVGNILL